MAEFQPGQTIETEESTIEVTVTENRPLAVGRHRFRLVVVDDSGNESAPDTVVVHVVDDQAPTAILTAPERVSFGVSFPLDGSRSSDVGGGRIVRYLWTLMD
jgi:hypothetical protein